MSDEGDISDRLLRIAANASNKSTEEKRNFSSLVAATRRNFRRNDVTSSPRRGRKRKKMFKRKVVLMKLEHAHFFLSNVELQFLKQRGLGLSDELLEIERDCPFNDIKKDIISLFQPHIQNLLRMCGFKLGKIEKSKKIHFLEDIKDGNDLENQLKQSKIIILPLNDFPDNLPVIEKQDHSLLQTSRNNSTESIIRSHQGDNDSDDIGLEQTSSNNLPTAFRAPRTSRLSTVPSTIHCQIADIDEEEELSESEDNHLDAREENIAEKCLLFPFLPEDAEEISIYVRRSNCLYDLMNLYMDEHIIDKKLQVNFLGEIGIDGGGLTKELFNLFFVKCEGIFFQDEDCLVPYLELNRLNELEKFVIIGRILQHMLILIN